METEAYKRRYQWRVTWPGEGHQDYVAFDDLPLPFGRISFDTTSHMNAGKWRWTMSHIEWQRQTIMPHHGWLPTASEACQAVEELYDRLKALHGR